MHAPLNATRPARLTVTDIAWGPAPDKPIIHDASFTAEPGETVAIVGPNGAGKSTLLRCLYRYHRPTAGTVALDGIDIWQRPARDCAMTIATVLQELPADFALTVREIVTLGRAPHAGRWGGASARDTEIVESAIATMGLSHLAGRDVGTLSGGEKQRTMIARALAQEPCLLILDEPTNHLDIRHQLEVLDILSRLDATVIVSLHDLALASAHADRVLVIEGGHMVDNGTPATVLTETRINSTFGVATHIDTHPITGRPRLSFHLPHHQAQDH